jgi:hypothetical protein
MAFIGTMEPYGLIEGNYTVSGSPSESTGTGYLSPWEYCRYSGNGPRGDGCVIERPALHLGFLAQFRRVALEIETGNGTVTFRGRRTQPQVRLRETTRSQAGPAIRPARQSSGLFRAHGIIEIGIRLAASHAPDIQ